MANREVGSPKIKVLITITKIKIAATTVNKSPKTELIAKGAVEKAVIPSIAYLNNFQKLHLVSPCRSFYIFIFNPFCIKTYKRS